MTFKFLCIVLYEKTMQNSAVTVYCSSVFATGFFLSPAINVTKAYGSLTLFSLHCTLDLTTHL